MRGAVRPRVLAVAAACVACLIALGIVATVAVYGFRNGSQRSATGVAGWLILLWAMVAVAIAIVVVIALVGVRALQRPLVELSRAADRLQVERLTMALRDIEAGTEPAPVSGISAPPELEGVAGALENLERFVHYHAKRAQRADRDLGRLLTGAADRVGARARLAEGIDLAEPPIDDASASLDALGSGLRRDEGALRALVPYTAPEPVAEEGATANGSTPVALPVPGTFISEIVRSAAQTTLRTAAVQTGELEGAVIDETASETVVMVLGEVIDAAIGGTDDAVVSGSLQPEGYHFAVDTPIGARAGELAALGEALRERDPADLPFGLRVAVQAGRQARLLVWLTVGGIGAQWHVLVPPDSVAVAPVVIAPPPPEPEPAPEQEPEPEPVLVPGPEPAFGPVPEAEPEPDLAEVPITAEAARRLSDALANLFERLEHALASRAPGGTGLDEDERIALLVDGTRLVGRLQQAQLCSSQELRALLGAIDVAVGAERSTPLIGSARTEVELPYEALDSVRARVAREAAKAEASGRDSP